MDRGQIREKFLYSRANLGISQYRLEQLTGVSRNRISMFECNYGDLTDEEIEKCFAIFEKRLEYRKKRRSGGVR